MKDILKRPGACIVFVVVKFPSQGRVQQTMKHPYMGCGLNPVLVIGEQKVDYI